MKIVRSLILIIAAAISVAAQTSFSEWPYYAEVTPERNATGIYELMLPLSVLDKARPDLADLRLYDSNNREIPYALRVLKEFDEQKVMEVRRFNTATTGSATEFSVDLGENHGEHNEIEVYTLGNNFRRQVEIEGGDSGNDWHMLNDHGLIFSFITQNSSVDSARISYANSRYRYLRVRVMRDPVVDRSAVDLLSVKVLRVVHANGRFLSWNVFVPPYQLQRNQGAHASVWTLDLDARVPCDRLKLEVPDDSFSRPFQVESVDDPENPQLLATGTITRHVGEVKEPLLITFDQEVIVRKLRLQITDYSNPTLNISAIKAGAPARQIMFEAREPPAQPLRLFFGNARMTAPHYDFEKELPLRLSNREPLDAEVGNVLGNREYKPEPLPLTERVPWLIYVVLAVSSIALAFILFSLAQTATRKSKLPSYGSAVNPFSGFP